MNYLRPPPNISGRFSLVLALIRRPYTRRRLPYLTVKYRVIDPTVNTLEHYQNGYRN